MLSWHEDIIQKFYTQLRHYLTRTKEIVDMMLQREMLTFEEHDHLHSIDNLYVVNENLLKLLLEKSSDAYNCFLEALRFHNQTHLFELLHTSG